MQIFRALAFATLFYSWTTLLAIAVLPLLLCPRRFLLAYGRFWITGALGLLRVTTGITHQIRGHHLLPNGPIILAVKHQSAWDTLAVNLWVDDPAIVLKKELISIPVFGWCLWRLRHIAVDRKGGSAALKRMVRQARDRAAEGRPIVIYPEGTRTKPGTQRPYHPGVAAIYSTLEIPVVPVALNSGLFWPRRSLRMHPGTITVEYLSPIPVGLTRQQFMIELEASLEPGAMRLYGEAIDQYFPGQSVKGNNAQPSCG